VLVEGSGEALAAGGTAIVDRNFVSRMADVLKRCLKEGVEIGIIVGAGNIWRGRQGTDMDPTRADSMGMLATAINAIALQDAFIHSGIDARVMTAVPMEKFAEPFVRDQAIRHLESGKVVIFGCGLGTPFLSTDTAAAVRAAEIGADIVLMAKNIDAIYTADPRKDPTAKKLDRISCKDILKNGLTALDSTATAFCMDHRLPVLAFGLSDPENIYRAVMGEAIGTVISD
ncbi:MAG: UMP kinase, partial [Clostridia bacterium]|nr:UMP kinase [Clostridia bacterium]